MPRSTAWSRNRGRTGNGTVGGKEGIDRQGGERTRNSKWGCGRGQGGQQVGEEKRQPLVENATEYQGLYEGGSADKIRHLQHQEQAERSTGVGTPGNVPGQHGPGHLPGEKTAQTESTPVSRTDTALLLRTRQVDTAAEWPYSTDRHHFLRWRPSDSTGQMP